MDRDAPIDIAYGEADVAEFSTGLRVPRPTRLGRAVEAGLTTLAMFFWLWAGWWVVAGWLADLFFATLPWSLALYLAAGGAVAAVGWRNWCAAAASGLDR